MTAALQTSIAWARNQAEIWKSRPAHEESARSYMIGHYTLLADAAEKTLAEPRLPREPDAMMRKIYSHGSVAEPEETHRVLYAHLTAPKTKEVEVWHVEYAAPHGEPCISGTYWTHKGASEAADGIGKQAGYSCIRVTGPHKQTVPA